MNNERPEAPKGYRLTGAYRPPHKGEVYLNMDCTVVATQDGGSTVYNSYWILEKNDKAPPAAPPRKKLDGYEYTAEFRAPKRGETFVPSDGGRPEVANFNFISERWILKKIERQSDGTFDGCTSSDTLPLPKPGHRWLAQPNTFRDEDTITFVQAPIKKLLNWGKVQNGVLVYHISQPWKVFRLNKEKQTTEGLRLAYGFLQANEDGLCPVDVDAVIVELTKDNGYGPTNAFFFSWNGLVMYRVLGLAPGYIYPDEAQ